MKRFYFVTAVFTGAAILIFFFPGVETLRLPLLVMLLLLYGVILLYGVSRIDSQFFIQTSCRGDAGSENVAITFDDGPNGKRSLEILEIMEKHGCIASFFLTGSSVKAYPDIVEEMVRRGHCIGNHSFSHSNYFPLFGSARIRREVEATNLILKEAGAGPIRFFRPPFGITNPNIARGMRTSGMDVAGWSIRSYDTRNEPAEKVVRRILKRIGGGDVILLHETSTNILEILVQLLPAIGKAGLTCVTLDQLLKPAGSD